jgi:hypothetical protein
MLAIRKDSSGCVNICRIQNYYEVFIFNGELTLLFFHSNAMSSGVNLANLLFAIQKTVLRDNESIYYIINFGHSSHGMSCKFFSLFTVVRASQRLCGWELSMMFGHVVIQLALRIRKLVFLVELV